MNEKEPGTHAVNRVFLFSKTASVSAVADSTSRLIHMVACLISSLFLQTGFPIALFQTKLLFLMKIRNPPPGEDAKYETVKEWLFLFFCYLCIFNFVWYKFIDNE